MNQTHPVPAPKKKTGLHVVYLGIACLLLGYAFLAKGDISIAPFLLIGAFVVMGVGIGMGWD
jgi:hypothetical protein